MAKPKVTKPDEERITPENIGEGSSSEGADTKLKAGAGTTVAEQDWLREYQVRTVAGMQIRGGIQSDPAAGSDAAKMKAWMLKGRRIKMFFPFVNGEAKSSMQTVNLNGYRLDFPKQTYVDVPELAANVLMESLQQTEAAVNQNLIQPDADEALQG